jgi:apolipoprotein N-acyltransferase
VDSWVKHSLASFLEFCIALYFTIFGLPAYGTCSSMGAFTPE